MRWAIALLLSLVAAGCAAPGSGITRVVVDGSVIAEDGGPLPGTQVNLLLPAAYGLKGLDALCGDPGDYGHDDQRRTVTSDAEGRFRAEFDPVTYSLAFWILPPLGFSFQGPPWPRLGLRVEGVEELDYLKMSGSGVEVLTYRLPERTPLDGAPVFRITGSVESADVPWQDGHSLEGHIVHLRIERTRRP